MPTAEAIIAAIRARGNDADDLRDAAHEASHAIEAGVPDGQWGRESIHRGVMRFSRGQQARSEVLARAVEQIVCQRIGIETESIDHWAFWACMEAVKSGIRFPSFEWFADAVRDAMESPEAHRMADAVIALADAPAPAKRKRTTTRKAVQP